MIYEKNSRLRYLEFFKGMQLIQESLYRIKVNREDQFFLCLSAQIRGLFIPIKNGKLIECEKYNSNDFILYQLSKELNIPLVLYVQNKIYEDKECQYYDHLFYTKIEPENNYQEVSYTEWLNSYILQVPSYKFKIWEVIKVLADKNGGAHYDKKLTQEKDYQLNIVTNKKGILVSNLILVKTAEVLYKLGLKLLKKLFDFQFNITVALNYKNILSQKKNLIKFKYDDVYIPLSININDNMITASLMDEYHKTIIIDVRNNTNNGLLFIGIGCSLNGKMQMIVNLGCNNEFKEITFKRPLLIGCTFMQNSKILFSDDTFEFGLGSLTLFNRKFNYDEYKVLYNTEKISAQLGNIAVLNGTTSAHLTENNDIMFDTKMYFEKYSEYIHTK